MIFCSIHFRNSDEMEVNLLSPPFPIHGISVYQKLEIYASE